jgi:pilus assembly protein CpaB
MRKRIVLIGVAVVLALVGTLAVYKYAKGADNRAVANGDAKKVLIAHSPITAGTSWVQAVKDGALVTENMPAGSVPSSALSSIDDSAMNAKSVATADIPSGQIVLRESFGAKQAPTGALSIPKDDIAISVNLAANADVAGYVNVQSEVVVFETYTLNGSAAKNAQKVVIDGDKAQVTRVVAPRLTVLAISQAPTTSVDGSKNSSTASASSTVTLTLAVSQTEAEKLINGQSNGQLYLGLLTSSSKTSADKGYVNVQPGPIQASPIFVN